MTATVAAWAFLAASLVSLTVYVIALAGMLRHPPVHERDAYRGLLRTACSRVLVACLYIGLAVTVLHEGDRLWPGASLVVFTLAQLCWQSNSVLDMRLKRKLRKEPEL